MAAKKTTLSWSDVKTKVADFDRAGLLGLVQEMYAANKDDHAFLHARFALGDDVHIIPKKFWFPKWID